MTTNMPLTDTALEALLARYAGRVSAEGLQAGIMADVAATEQARRPVIALPGWLGRPAAPGRLAAVPAIAWVLLLTGLLVGLVVGGLAGGLWRGPDRALVAEPSPSPTTEINPAAATILATTKARPLPAQATCPRGSNPDAPGPAEQERPSVAWGGAWTGAMAFDRRAGRIVLVADGGALWTYDVCTNTWQRATSAGGPPDGVISLVYDADSDRTLAFTDDGQVWSFDLAADRWTKGGVSFPVSFPPEGRNAVFGTKFYHDPSGLVVVYDGTSMWAYNVDTDTLAQIPQQPDPALPAGSGLPDGWVAFGYDPRADLVVAVVVPYQYDDASNPSWMKTGRKSGDTWTFDPGTGAWRREASTVPSDLIVCGLSSFPKGSTDCWETNGRAVFDEASSSVVFMNRDWGRPTAPGRVDAYATRLGAWSTLFYGPGWSGDVSVATWCASMPPVYDPLDERIVCLGKGPDSDIAGVSAFSTATGQWRWLLEPPADSQAPRGE